MSKERELSQEETIEFFNKLHKNNTGHVGYPQNRNQKDNIILFPTVEIVNKKKK